MRTEMWTYSGDYSAQNLDVEGFDVVATDGEIC